MRTSVHLSMKNNILLNMYRAEPDCTSDVELNQEEIRLVVRPQTEKTITVTRRNSRSDKGIHLTGLIERRARGRLYGAVNQAPRCTCPPPARGPKAFYEGR